MNNMGNPHKRSPHSHFFAGSSVKMKVLAVPNAQPR